MMTTDRVFDRLEEAALGALDDYMEYRGYAGQNPDVYKRARLGMPVLSTYGRVRGTRANERQLDMLERRMASGDVVLPERAPLAAVTGQTDTDAETLDTNPEPTTEAAGRNGARKRERKS